MGHVSEPNPALCLREKLVFGLLMTMSASWRPYCHLWGKWFRRWRLPPVVTVGVLDGV